MKYEDVVNNVRIYGLEESVREIEEPVMEGTEVKERNITPLGGYGNFLNGVIVQFDLTFTNNAWIEAERYRLLEVVSAPSAMHRITRFDLDEAYIEYTDPRIIAIMKEKAKEYNDLESDIAALHEMGNDTTTLEDLAAEKYLEILYSNPAGFRMTARMTTNYRQLKKIYKQRRLHRLPEWRAFCDWIERLPHAEFIVERND